MQKSLGLQSLTLEGPSFVGSSMLRALNFQLDRDDEANLFDIPVSPAIKFENSTRFIATSKSKRKASLKSSAGQMGKT